MVWQGIDRRKFPRANYKCLVTIRKKTGMQTFTTQTENIGAGGVCVILPDPLEIFAPVDLVITLLHGMPPLKCAGSVVWVVKSTDSKKTKAICYDTGIEFVNLSQEYSAKIKKIVDDLIKEQEI